MRSYSFGLDTLNRNHKRNSSSSFSQGLLDEPLSTRRRNRLTNSTRLLKWLIITIVALVLIFFWKYELHVELQLYSRGWIRESILPIVDTTSSKCFSPSHVSTTLYNTTLSNLPNYVELHPGIGLPFGQDCYDFAKTLPNSPKEIEGMEMNLPRETLIHLYWRNDLLPLGSRQINLIESILFTQSKKHTKVIFWTNANNVEQVETLPILQPLLNQFGSGSDSDKFVIKRVEKQTLAKGTPMEENKMLEIADQQAWVDGDLVRILVLYQFGGIWIDFDTVLTGKRDLRVLLEHEWVTQWDCYDKIYQPLNGAMMHFYKNSPYLCEMLYVMSNSKPPSKNSVDWGSRLYHKVYRSLLNRGIKPFKILPYCFTDGVSCRLDNRLPDPFDGSIDKRKWGKERWENLGQKLENVWAVHLHNRWDKAFPKNGYIQEFVLKPIEEKKRLIGGSPNFDQTDQL